MTIVPTKMYFYKGKAKIQVAVGKGKKLYDKRLVKKKEIGREKKQKFLVEKTNDLFKYRVKSSIRGRR